MYKYACLNAISENGLSAFGTNYQKTDEIQGADAILVRSANMHEMALDDHVLAVARAGAGVNNIPLDEYASKGIVVFNTPGANANGVKEMVFAGMLLAARDIVGGVNWVKENADDENIKKDVEKQKKVFAGTELSGKKLGVIGLGAIGNLVANAAVHFGMEVYGYDPYISVNWAWNLSRSVRHINDVETIYRECDYITIHVPLLESTKKMIGKDAIALMKPTAVLVNYARDLLVDEDAVLEALEQNRLACYVCDFPNPKTTGHDKVILTPHLGASTMESEENCAVMAVEQLKDFLENGNIRNSVNYPACSMGECHAQHRIAIYHKNVKHMIRQFADVLSYTNVANLSNTSRGEYAYTMIDIDDAIQPETVEALKQIGEVFRVRVVR
ncbi:MAG TPA: 3-phosphoglycerate dehydrogenase [Lachnospiraceae bacterium]|nr:3-phosphoglycerate dehydrogenase [Lachnospiraceae bacterium]